MPRIKFEVAKGYENAGVRLPERATAGSCGYDIRVLKGRIINPGEGYIFHTGVKAIFPKWMAMLIIPRSGFGIKRGGALRNTIGVIDSDYYGNVDNDGEIILVIENRSNGVLPIIDGQRVCQCLFVPVAFTDDDKWNHLEDTDTAREGGVGSTGEN